MTHAPMTFEEAQQKVAAEAKAPRITVDHLRSQIAEARYLRDGTTTICVLELLNGFKVIGHSTPASPQNFMEDVGKGYAYDNAFRQLWPLFGFLLREQLYSEEFQEVQLEPSA